MQVEFQVPGSFCRSHLARASALNALSELIGCLWEGDRGILLDQRFVQGAESFVLLVGSPHLSVEVDQYHILHVGSLITLVLDHLRGLDLNLEWDLEKVRPRSPRLMCALHHVLNEDLCWMEHITEFAAHSHSVLYRFCLVLVNLKFLG